MTLSQRFGSALNLNIHFHMLFLDGVYFERSDGSVRLRWVIEKILTHLDLKGGEPEATRRPPCRAPPQRGLFDETG